MFNTSAFSPGKVIVSGEHSVVYGQPALVSSIDLGITSSLVSGQTDTLSPYLSHILHTFQQRFQVVIPANLGLKINSTLPQKSGLGSSAALAHSVVRTLVNYFQLELSQDEIFQLVWDLERFMHGQSSGLDPAAVVYGGLNIFQQGQRRALKSNVLENFQFLLIDSGEASESTGEMVAKVPDLPQQKRDPLIEKMGQVTIQFIQELEQNHFQTELITENEKLLEDLGVVGNRTQTMIRQIEQIDGTAKITGAGGLQEGSGFMIACHENWEKLEAFVKKKNWSYFPLKLTE